MDLAAESPAPNVNVVDIAVKSSGCVALPLRLVTVTVASP
jgi:hypothetical protein